MKKIYFMFVLSMFTLGLVWAQTTINFDTAVNWTLGSVASFTSYASDHSYVDGIFSATGGRALRNTTTAQDGYPGALGTYAWRLENTALVDWRITIASGGVSTFSMEIRRWDGSPSPAYNLEYSTDSGSNWTLVSAINNTTLDELSAWKTFNGTINSANTNILIRLKATGTTERIHIDNFVWTGYTGGGNTPPSISNITKTPASDIESTDAVSISADITDSDGTLAVTELSWGTATGSYDFTIPMSLNTKGTYSTDSNIPAQANGTTVYYVVYAEDDDGDYTQSTEQSYLVRDPATTTIPYAQTFSGSFGDTYTYSVSGTKPWYILASDNATANGYQSALEEQWLILPAINFDSYTYERMSFNVKATYGTIDANNYLKLMYSPDYYGLGNPTSATWTEVLYTMPTIGGGESSSGVLDLTGISGTNVYLAFKYYSTTTPTQFEIDDISIYLAMPVITVSTASLSGFTYPFESGPSGTQSFVVSGTDLTGDILISAPTNYEIMLNNAKGVGFSSQVTLYHSGGIVTDNTIDVQLKQGLAIGAYNGETINITSDGAVAKTVTCNGEVTTPPAPDAPVATEATFISADGFTANWGAVSGATSYELDVYTLPGVAAADLFISEYIEGSSSNKAIELFNGTGDPIDLSGYTVKLGVNGAAWSSSITPTSILDDGDVYVIANSGSNAAILAQSDVTSTVTYYNGDDAVGLFKGETLIDVIGVYLSDPGTAWDVAGVTNGTVEHTLIRKPIVDSGNTNWAVSAGTNADNSEWIVQAQNYSDDLGAHSYTGGYNYVHQGLNVGDVTSYPVSGLNSNTTYYYVVRAVGTYGTSASSNDISSTTSNFDYPDGTPITDTFGNVITINGGSANEGTGVIPGWNNGTFNEATSFYFDLLGAGPWTITIQTTAPWGAYYQNGEWHSVENSGGFIVFVITAAKDLGVPIVLGDADPTLPVELSSFTATITNDLMVKIAWIAQSETNHSGYNVLRAELSDLTGAIRINPSLIDNGTNLGTQISYSYTDNEAYSNMRYYYWLESVALDGVCEYYGPLSVTIGDPNLDPLPPAVPLATKLLYAFPNPFNPNTNLRYSLKEAGKVNIGIYNVKGQLVRSFSTEHNAPGYYQVNWDGRDASGQPVSSGIYMYRMSSGKYTSSKKMILAK